MDKEAAKAALLTDTTLADRWGLSVRTIKRWRTERKGKVPPSFFLGESARYRLDDVIAFEDAKKHTN